MEDRSMKCGGLLTLGAGHMWYSHEEGEGDHATIEGLKAKAPRGECGKEADCKDDEGEDGGHLELGIEVWG